MLSNSDFALLESKLVSKTERGKTDKRLIQKLRQAQVVADAECPDHVVSVGSVVHLQDLGTGSTTKWTIVTPDAANEDHLQVSALSNLGKVLLGLPTGSVINWRLPNGHIRDLKIVVVQSGRRN